MCSGKSNSPIVCPKHTKEGQEKEEDVEDEEEEKSRKLAG